MTNDELILFFNDMAKLRISYLSGWVNFDNKKSYYYKNELIFEYNYALNLIIFKHEEILKYVKQIKENYILDFYNLHGKFATLVKFDINETELVLIKLRN